MAELEAEIAKVVTSDPAVSRKAIKKVLKAFGEGSELDKSNAVLIPNEESIKSVIFNYAPPIMSYIYSIILMVVYLKNILTVNALRRKIRSKIFLNSSSQKVRTATNGQAILSR